MYLCLKTLYQNEPTSVQRWSDCCFMAEEARLGDTKMHSQAPFHCVCSGLCGTQLEHWNPGSECQAPQHLRAVTRKKQSPSLKSGNKRFACCDVRYGPAAQMSGEVLYWLTVWWSGSGQKQTTFCDSVVPLGSSIPNLCVLALCFDGLINPNAAWNPAHCLPGSLASP